MGAVSIGEVRRGLVVHLDTTVLRAVGGSSTNAELRAGIDRAVQGPHYFLIVAVDAASESCTAVPLFSSFAPGSERLDDAKKSGLKDKWIGEASHFSCWQHWRIPLAAVAAASGSDEATPQNRRKYASDDAAVHEAIVTWAGKNRAPWRVA